MFGGGVIVYASMKVAVSRKIELENDEDEITWIQLQFNHEKYILGVLYRPQWHRRHYRTPVNITKFIMYLGCRYI